MRTINVESYQEMLGNTMQVGEILEGQAQDASVLSVPSSADIVDSLHRLGLGRVPLLEAFYVGGWS